jgi:hypothetical protein
MEQRQLNSFADAEVNRTIKLALARDLQRMWSELLAEPLPPNLQHFIDRLELAGRRHASPHSS